jgi:uncharacterized membrane protein
MKAMKKEMPQAAVENSTCVAVFETHEDAEKAVRELAKASHDMKALSIIGTDYRTEEHVVGYYNMGDRVNLWGSEGAFWGGLWGVLFGSAFFFVPGIGPLVLAGPIVGMLVGGLEGALVVGGLTALGAALYSIGIPRDSVVDYETALKSHKFLLIAHGTPLEVQQAREILRNAGIEGAKLHNATDVSGE